MMILLHRFDDTDRHRPNVRHRFAMLFHHSAFTKHGFHPFFLALKLLAYGFCAAKLIYRI
ncbi:MAG: hypothetical protein KAH15_00615 [Candidatus Marinimicrobia bacterium]|nr:hypothetical protein [Candidatus Neomarinimicrobiota bacterium]